MPGRCFLAISLSVPFVGVLTASRDAFLDVAPAWAGEKWVRSDLMHVTVAFFGAVPQDSQEPLLHRLRTVAHATAPFELRLAGACAMPSRNRASMLWAAMEGDVEAAADLRDEALAAAGCAQDRRRFDPHVTLVRTRRVRRAHHFALHAASELLSAAGKTSVGRVSVRSLTVYSSVLDGSGPSYQTLAHVALEGRYGVTPTSD